jgi:hypothetical protein
LPAVEKVKIVEANGEWESKDGNPGLHIIVEIVKKAPKDKKGRQQQYSRLHRYIMDDSEWADQRMAELCDAFLGNRPKQFNLSKLVGKVGAAKLRSDMYDGEEQAKIARFLEVDDDLEEDEDDEPEEEDEEDADDEGEEEDDGDEEEEEDEEDEEDDYNDWSIPQLRAELKRRELPSAGKKDVLVAALEEDDNTDEEEEEEDEEEEDYSEYSTKELKDELRRRGLRVRRGMTDEDLIAALEEDDEDEDPLDDDE